jgi:hypothetical protein
MRIHRRFIDMDRFPLMTNGNFAIGFGNGDYFSNGTSQTEYDYEKNSIF